MILHIRNTNHGVPLLFKNEESETKLHNLRRYVVRCGSKVLPNLNFLLMIVNNLFKSSAQNSDFRAVVRSENLEEEALSNVVGIRILTIEPYRTL